jgi:hypothetical protein
MADEVVARVCVACSNCFTDIKHVNTELATALGIDMAPEMDYHNCGQCGKELRIGNSMLIIEILSAQIKIEKGKDNYLPIRYDCRLELCATCGTNVGVEEARVAILSVIASIGNCSLPDAEPNEDWMLDDEVIQRCTAPADPAKLAEAGIVTREHLKGRFFRDGIDWGSSGVWETDEPCVVGGMGYNLDYDEIELPEWLLNRFHFWEHWHEEAETHTDLPIDFDWQSFQAYGRSLAVDLKYHLGPEISVCYRDKEITLGPLFREPMPKVWPYPELIWKRDGLTTCDE